MAARPRATGLVMGFGAGTLLSAVAYELVPEASFRHGVGVGAGFLAGALAYYVGDRLVDQAGGAQRQDLDGKPLAGSGIAGTVALREAGIRIAASSGCRPRSPWRAA